MIERELTDRLCMLKGFVSGSLFAISILSGYGFSAQTAIFVIAAILFMENVFDLGRQSHVFTAVLLNLFGIALAAVLWGHGLIFPHTILIAILAILLYGYLIYKRA